MSSRGKKKKEYRAKYGPKKAKKKLGGYKDCCGNCLSRLNIFKRNIVKCNKKESKFFKAEMPKDEYCGEHVH